MNLPPSAPKMPSGSICRQQAEITYPLLPVPVNRVLGRTDTERSDLYQIDFLPFNDAFTRDVFGFSKRYDSDHLLGIADRWTDLGKSPPRQWCLGGASFTSTTLHLIPLNGR
jgi:hypothetical protein